MEAVAPPRIRAREVGIAVAERIREPGLQQLGELAALLVREARVAAVRAGVLQIDLLMRHIQVAADDHRLLPVERDEIGAERIVPGHAVVKAL